MRFGSLLVLALFFPMFAHASVVFTEIMYDVSGTDTGREWVEITNTGSSSIDASGYKFFEANTNHALVLISGSGTLSAGSSAVIADDATKFKIDWPGYSGTLFDSSFSLSNTGESLALRDGALATLYSLTYNPSIGAAGDGNSLQLVSGAWASAAPTPGTSASTAPLPADDSSGSSSATTTAPTTLNGTLPEYIPIPLLRIVAGGDRTVSSSAEVPFTAVVYDGNGNKRDEALVTWSFGDGMRKIGASVFHQYYSPGEYLAIVHASTPSGGDARYEITVTVRDASIKIASVSSRGITLANNDSRTLDISLWRLSAGGQEFKIPEDTQILAGRTILFPSQIIQLPISDTASLLYPSGEIATTYPLSLRQPSPDMVSYKKVSEVEPIISASANVPVHEKAVIAPAATNELAAVGAALPAEQPKAGGLFKSPWFYSLLGVMAIAGAAFIFI